MRELVLDTETTGLDHEDGHRLVEIGIVELENHMPTGNYFHHYLNPERASDYTAEKVHGLSSQFLSDKPKFFEIVDEFLNFISNSKIIIHNATFDVGFINSELERYKISALDENRIIDTLQLAKKKFLGQSASLDSLCKRYNIDLSDRNTHGALKDAKLLASVYLELIGGRQSKLDFLDSENSQRLEKDVSIFDLNEYYSNLKKRDIKRVDINQSDLKAHLESIENIENSIWRKLII